MSKRSSYFSNYESPNIVIVPTVDLIAVNKLHDTAAITGNTYVSPSQQNTTNKNSSVSFETRCNNLVNYDRNVTASAGITGHLEVDASKHHSILPIISNEVSIEQEIKQICTTNHYPNELTVSTVAQLQTDGIVNREQISNTNDETKKEAEEECVVINNVLDPFDLNNPPTNHPIGKTNSSLINSMTSSGKTDKMEGKIKYLNDHNNFSGNVLQQNQMSIHQPSCSSRKKHEEVSSNKDNDMKKYLKQLWTRRIEKMKEKCNTEKSTNESAKSITKIESTKLSKYKNNMERKYKPDGTESKHELNKYETLSEAQKSNLTPGALKRYLDYQRFLQNYHKNLKSKQQVNQNDQNKCSNNSSGSKKIKDTSGKCSEKNTERKHKKSPLSVGPSKQKMKELNEQLTKRIKSVKDKEHLKAKIKKKERNEASENSITTIQQKKNKEDSREKNNSTERINQKEKRKKIISYVDYKKNKEECREKKKQYEHPKKIKQSNDGINRKLHEKKEGGSNKSEKIRYSPRKKIEEAPKITKKKPLKRLSNNISESNDIKRKNKNAPLRTTDIRKKITSRNLTKTGGDEMDLRSILSRKRSNSQCYGESKRFKASTPTCTPRENLIITVKQDVVPKPLANTKTACKPRIKKTKKMKLVINISCPNSDDSDYTSNECSSPLQDLSFLDDIDIDGIVDSLDVGRASCESNTSTKEDFSPANISESILNKTIIGVLKEDNQLKDDLCINMEVAKERLMVNAHNLDEEICNHSTKTQHDIKTEVEQVENLCEDTTTISTIPINDDVYEVIDITNDTEVIDLSDDQREKDDDDKVLTTSNETIEDIHDDCIILINDDSKDGIEPPHTLDTVNVNTGVVFIEDNVIEKIKPQMTEKNCHKSLIEVEDKTESKPKLAEFNAIAKIEYVCNVKQSNDVSPRKLENASDNEQLQVAAVKDDRNEPTVSNSKSSPMSTNDKVDKLQDDVNNSTKTAANGSSDLITEVLPVTTKNIRIKTEVTSEISELLTACIKNNTITCNSKMALNEPANLNTKSSLDAAKDKFIKSEVIAEINKLQPAVTKDDAKTVNIAITSSKPASLNTNTQPVAGNDKLNKTEAISIINEIQPALMKNNTEPSNSNIKFSPATANSNTIKQEAISKVNDVSKITPSDTSNLNTETPPLVAQTEPIKTEKTTEINNLPPTVMKASTKIAENKIESSESANLKANTPPVAINDKPIKTEDTTEINKLQPTVMKTNTKTAENKIESSEFANLKANPPLVATNDNKLQPTVMKNSTQLANSNTNTQTTAVNDKPIKIEASPKINELQPPVIKNNTQPANSNTSTPLTPVNDKPIEIEASPKTAVLQAGAAKDNIKTVYKLPKIPKISRVVTTSASKPVKTEDTSKINESQNDNTETKSKPNTQTIVKKENSKPKSPVVKTGKGEQDAATSNNQEEDVALALWYMKSIEKRMFDYLEQKYSVLTCVHQGYFSNIYQCKGANGKLYALKILASRFHSMAIYKDKMLTNLQKSTRDRYHILEMIHNFNFSGEWCFLSEFYPRNLKQALQCKTSFHIDLVQILSRQLVAAVSTLTNNQIIHTDIKPSHILLNSTNDHLKLCGFDRSDYNYNVKIIPSFGTTSYRAPEVILGFDANYSIDVWATALVMHEMATGTKLFPGRFNNDILYKQLCTLGALPFDMVEQSKYAYVHFYGTNFKRQVGNGKWHFEEFHGINNKLRNKLFEAYNKDWALSRTSWEVTVDLDKIEMLHRLLERMLIMDPRHRIPISFAGASEFISDYNVFI